MRTVRRIILWAAAIVLTGVCALIACDLTFARDATLAFDGVPSPLGPLETVTGVPFPREHGRAVVTEEHAHLRIPFARTGVAKKLILTVTFDPGTTDVLEVGLRKGAFWLDYERIPLHHSVLDALARSDSGWRNVQSGDSTVFLPPDAAPTPTSVDDFLAHPPTDGVIGLYGNAVLTAPGVATAPFRADSDPTAFRAMYAHYRPQGSGSGPRTRTVTFPLDRAYQNPDGSFDVMFFAERRDHQPPHYAIDEMSVRISPVLPSKADLMKRVRQQARTLLMRPTPAR
jgi:hypothetical protein